MSAPTDFNDEWASAWEWARMYRALGLQVVPAHTPHAGQWKRPAVEAWVEFQDALVPDLLFARWYDPNTGEHRQRRNMGLICGAASGALLVVDLDVGDAKDGRLWWTGLLAVEANGLEPETVAQVTGGGGRQLFFRAPEGWTPPTFKAPAVGVDVRGQGGFVMAPPSMHASGRIYDFEPGRAPWLCEIAEAPPWLVEAIDRLRLEHGGTPTGPREHTPSGEVKNAFGLDVDDREHKLLTVVWAAVVDLRRASPIPPSEAEQAAEIERLWVQYEQTTKSRLDPRPGMSNGELLELEGRGRSELVKKWAYAMARWDSKVAEAAKVPKPEDAFAHVQADREWLASTDSTLAPQGPRSLGDVLAEPKPRRWLVEGWVPHADVTLFGAKGGLGKSLLALQLACARAVGAPWVGLPTVKGRSLFVTCEDTDDEVDRRFYDVKRGLGYGVGNPFADALAWSRKFQENRLAIRDASGNLTLGAFMAPLLATLQAVQPSLLILDTAADVFAGNENDRQEVNWFVKTALGQLIQASDDAMGVLLLAHPAKATESQYSGSTAWEGSVRSRLFLDQPEDGAAVERTLQRAKANYAGDDEAVLALMWAGGVFNRLADVDPRVRQLAQTVANEVDFAWRSGRAYSEKRGHERYLDGALVRKLTTADQPRELVQAAVRHARENDLIVKSKNTAKRGWKVPYAD